MNTPPPMRKYEVPDDIIQHLHDHHTERGTIELSQQELKDLLAREYRRGRTEGFGRGYSVALPV